MSHWLPLGGIIPALAGNTFRVAALTGTDGDHPRSRGEYCCLKGGNRCIEGSSPLSRGIRPAPRTPQFPHRIIPALAGNTPQASRFLWGPRDHPRSRGEYQLGKDEFIEAYSQTARRPAKPLVRAHLRKAVNKAHHRVGIIPALAGNTCRAAWPGRGHWDHPRSRGEYSSPPLRTYNLLRIIPALAGNTHAAVGDIVDSSDHPRSRGEY